MKILFSFLIFLSLAAPAAKAEQDADRAQAIAALERAAEKALAETRKLFQDERYQEAAKEVKLISDIGWTDKKYLDRVKKLDLEIQEKIRTVLKRLLSEASVQRQKGESLPRARELFQKALSVDPSSEEAARGLREIRGEQFQLAKRLFEDGILEESVGESYASTKSYETCVQITSHEEKVPVLEGKVKRSQDRDRAEALARIFMPDALPGTQKSSIRNLIELLQ